MQVNVRVYNEFGVHTDACMKLESKIKLSLEDLEARLSQKSGKGLFRLKLCQLAPCVVSCMYAQFTTRALCTIK